MPKLINLTKGTLTLHDVRGESVDLPPDPRHIGVVAMGEHRRAKDEVGHAFSVNMLYVRDIKGMPEPEDGTLYVVPVEVAMALQGTREDIVFPAEEAQVRDATGQMHRISHLRRIISQIT